MVRNSIWLVVGLLATAAGIIGIFLPLVPTTPFLLLAAYAFARSSPRLHTWLVAHPVLGRPIEDWQRHGAISRGVKITAVVTMGVTVLASIIVGFPPWILILQGAIMTAVATFILSRPDKPNERL